RHLWRRSPAVFLVLLEAVLGEAVAALAVPAVLGAFFLAPGRYLYGAVLPVAVLFVAGLWAEFRGREPALAISGVFTAASLAIVLLYVAGLPTLGPIGPGVPPAGTSMR